MTFKVGDKVKVTGNSCNHGLPVGVVGSVLSIIKDVYIVKFKTFICHMIENDLELHKETKIKTRPIDYTGCNPEIEEALKNNQEVYCRVWDTEKDRGRIQWVRGYIKEYYLHYTDTEGVNWRNAEPVKTTVKVKKASEIVKWLEDNGYRVEYAGYWRNPNNMPDFCPCRFQYCGKEPSKDHNWHPEWLEEVDE